MTVKELIGNKRFVKWCALEYGIDIEQLKTMSKKDIYRYMKMWYYAPEFACGANGNIKEKIGAVLAGKDRLKDSLFVGE